MKTFFCCTLLLLTLGLMPAQDRYHRLDQRLADSQPATVQAFLYQRYPFLQAENHHLELQHRRRSAGGLHYYFRQTYQGFPLYRQGIKVNLSADGTLWSLLGSLDSVNRPGSASFSYPLLALEARMAETVAAYEVHSEKIWWPVAGRLQPAYRVETFSREQAVSSWEIIFDATTGVELQREPRDKAFASGQDSSGIGRVFLPDPCTKANVFYGDRFIDNNDAHSPLLESLMDTVVLLDLRYEHDTFYLDGPYVRLEDRQSFFIEPASSPDGTFFFTRDQAGFEDVMVYYHIDAFQRYVQALGFDSLHNYPVVADAHGLGNQDNSRFVPNGLDSYLLFGDGGVDDAEDADPIVHEYGHALTHAAAPDTRGGVERNGLEEGYADYLAASYSAALSPHQQELVYNWDGHNEFWPGRVVDEPSQYPPDVINIYTLGTLWASTLMALRADLGAAVVDRLQLQMLYGNVTGMSMADGSNLLLEADRALYGGAHEAQITFAFCQRNILMGPDCLSVGRQEAAPEASWELYPNPGRDQVTLRWQGSPATLRAFNLLGQQVGQWNAGKSGNTTLRLALPAGLYLLRLEGEDRSLGQRRWVCLD